MKLHHKLALTSPAIRFPQSLVATACFLIAAVNAALHPYHAAASVVYTTTSSDTSTANPNGTWSYGWTASLGSPFTLFTVINAAGNWIQWNRPNSGYVNSEYPLVIHNAGTSTINYANHLYIPPGELDLHPGLRGELSVVRWTAPTAGSVSISGHFQGNDTTPTSSDAHVLHNSVSVFDTLVTAYGQTRSFSQTFTVAANDTIDFAVGWGTNHDFNYDNTGLSATITFEMAPSLKISSLQTPTTVGVMHSFIATDTITLQATATPASINNPVKWTVVGIGAASGISGFPSKEVHNTDNGGLSTFTFRPSDNPTFVNSRQTVWATAGTQANDPIGFEVIAELEVNAQTVESRLSQVSLGSLLQDETDTLRQEYFDFQIPVPSRAAVVPSLGAGYNQGNYGVQVSVDLPGHYSSILNAYRGSTVMIDAQTVLVPPTADVVISSGFRNPRRNLAVGSVHPNSKHTQGRALDLQPVPTFTLERILHFSGGETGA